MAIQSRMNKERIINGSNILKISTTCITLIDATLLKKLPSAKEKGRIFEFL